MGKSSSRTWNDGPPPYAGWWNARVTYRGISRSDAWGWWDGKVWSTFTDEQSTPADAALAASQIGAQDGACGHVQWSDYYPEGARVPRIAP